jgi:hypothetical protein
MGNELNINLNLYHIIVFSVEKNKIFKTKPEV